MRLKLRRPSPMNRLLAPRPRPPARPLRPPRQNALRAKCRTQRRVSLVHAAPSTSTGISSVVRNAKSDSGGSIRPTTMRRIAMIGPSRNNHKPKSPPEHQLQKPHLQLLQQRHSPRIELFAFSVISRGVECTSTPDVMENNFWYAVRHARRIIVILRQLIRSWRIIQRHIVRLCCHRKGPGSLVRWKILKIRTSLRGV